MATASPPTPTRTPTVKTDAQLWQLGGSAARRVSSERHLHDRANQRFGARIPAPEAVGSNEGLGRFDLNT